MVKIVTNFENGVQIEEAPTSLRTIAPYIDVSLYGLLHLHILALITYTSFLLIW